MPNVLRNPPDPGGGEGGNVGDTVIRRTTTTTYTHGRAWLPWLLGAILVPLALAWLWLYPFGGKDRVQDQLGDKANSALAMAGVVGAGIKWDGTDATLCGITEGNEDAARQAVQGVSGVGAVRVAPAGDPVCGPVGGGTTPTNLSFGENGGRLVLNGNVPSEEAWTELVTAATASAGGMMVVDQLTIQPGTELAATPTELGNLAGTIATQPGNVNASWDGNTLTLTGAVPTEADKAAAEQAAATAVPVATIDNQLTVDPNSAGASGGGGQLQQQINALVQGAPVTFEPDTANLTEQAGQTLQKVAPLIAAVQGVRLLIEGHVAAVSSPTDGLNLSQERAEAVKQRLAELGVPVDSITVEGRGDAEPAADNNTPEGQALNRRVEIIVQR
jgi:OOP family OmpA-OmpF porin